jgi:predicted small secreted protein
MNDRIGMSDAARARIALLALSALAIAVLFALSGCNSIEGVGRDLRGMVDGMLAEKETNGQPVRTR